MSASPSALSPFQVMQFSLGLNAAGQPTQTCEVIGQHRYIETAFVTAQFAAVQCCRRLRQALLAPAKSNSDEPPADAASIADRIELRDTEWGYDVRREGLVVERFWVHDRAPNELGS